MPLKSDAAALDVCCAQPTPTSVEKSPSKSFCSETMRAPITKQRFLREARITGQLEHPNIVPVHELGRREDGTLYYTMKLVRGHTLADALEDCEDLEQRLRYLDAVLDPAFHDPDAR